MKNICAFALSLALPILSMADKYPFDLPQLQPVLRECRLQCPSTSKAVVSGGNFDSFEMPGRFYLDKDESVMAISLNRKDGNRCELRHNKMWSSADGGQRIEATLKIDPGDDGSFTFMQIHSKDYRGTDGVDYEKGPPLMIGRNYKADTDHLWASLRLSMEPKKGGRFDLGPRPDGFFNMKVVLENGMLEISINDEIRLLEDASHFDVLPQNYFKTGVYLHKGHGPHVIEYKELKMGPVQSDQDVSNKTAPKPVETEKPTEDPYVQEPTETATKEKEAENPSKEDDDEWHIVDARVDKLVLVDTETNQDLFDLADGQILDLNVLSNDSGSYTIAIEIKDSSTTKAARTPTPTSPPTAVASTTLTDESPEPEFAIEIADLILVDADTGEDLFALMDGDIVDTTVLPRFSVRANTEPATVGSVRFYIDGVEVKTENFVPYAIAGDHKLGGRHQERRVNPWEVNSGEYTVEARVYTKKHGKGDEGKPLSVTIAVI